MDRKLPRGITVRGNSLQLSFSYKDERFRESLRMEPTRANVTAAERMLFAIRHDIAMNRFDYGDYFPESKHALRLSRKIMSSITVEVLLNDWLKKIKPDLAYSTLKDYESAVSFHLIPKFGATKISDFKGGDVEEWLGSLKISGKRKRNIIIPLRQSLQEAVYEGLIDRNPMDRVRSPKHARREPNPFSPSEVKRILSVLKGVERNLFQFAFETGLRTSELIALSWEDVDLEIGVIHVRSACVRGRIKETKTQSGWRKVPLSSGAHRALLYQKKLMLNNDGYVFYDPSTLVRWSNDQIIRKRVWKKAIRDSGVEYRNPYQTRHTYASRRLSKGENPMKVAKQMGHKDWGMLRQVYGRWITDE